MAQISSCFMFIETQGYGVTKDVLEDDLSSGKMKSIEPL